MTTLSNEAASASLKNGNTVINVGQQIAIDRLDTALGRDQLAALQAHPGLRTLHRPANLEDLFLKMTGRQIREDG